MTLTAEWLERLPDGVLLTGHGASGLRRTGRLRVRLADGVERWPSVDCEPCWAWAYVLTDLALVMTDTVTAAVVAARVIWPWLSADREHRAAHRDVEHVVRAAERMQPLTPADLDTLARLARAAMEGA